MGQGSILSSVCPSNMCHVQRSTHLACGSIAQRWQSRKQLGAAAIIPKEVYIRTAECIWRAACAESYKSDYFTPSGRALKAFLIYHLPFLLLAKLAVLLVTRPGTLSLNMLISTIIKYPFPFKNVFPKTNSLRPSRLHLSSAAASLHSECGEAGLPRSSSFRDFLPSSQPFSAGLSSALDEAAPKISAGSQFCRCSPNPREESVSNPCRRLEASPSRTEMDKPRTCLQSHSQRRWDHSCCQAQTTVMCRFPSRQTAH